MGCESAGLELKAALGTHGNLALAVARRLRPVPYGTYGKGLMVDVELNLWM